MKRLVRQGVLVQEQDDWYVADGIAEDIDTSALRPLQQGSIVYRIAFGPRASRKVLTLREAVPIDTDSDYERRPLTFSVNRRICSDTERSVVPRKFVRLNVMLAFNAPCLPVIGLALEMRYCNYSQLLFGFEVNDSEWKSSGKDFTGASYARRTGFGECTGQYHYGFHSIPELQS